MSLGLSSPVRALQFFAVLTGKLRQYLAPTSCKSALLHFQERQDELFVDLGILGMNHLFSCASGRSAHGQNKGVLPPAAGVRLTEDRDAG